MKNRAVAPLTLPRWKAAWQQMHTHAWLTEDALQQAAPRCPALGEDCGAAARKAAEEEDNSSFMETSDSEVEDEESGESELGRRG